MVDHVSEERDALVDSLRAVGPDAPTLCTGWNARTLLAHLIRRERSLLEVGARVRLPLAHQAAEEAMRRYADTHDYSDMLATFQAGPPIYSFFAFPPTQEALNLLEYVVHHEDVRRGADPDINPRELADDQLHAIFGRLAQFARIMMRKAPEPVELRWNAVDVIQVGGGAPAVVVTGEPVELALVAFGRQRAAQVTYSGDDDSIAKLTGASLGA